MIRKSTSHALVSAVAFVTVGMAAVALRTSSELLLRASTSEERMRIGGGALVGLASEVLGVAAIRNNCTG